MQVNRFDEEMQRQNISCYRLARMVGVDKSTIARLRNGTIKDIRLSLAKKIADVFGMSIDNLWFLE